MKSSAIISGTSGVSGSGSGSSSRAMPTLAPAPSSTTGTDPPPVPRHRLMLPKSKSQSKVQSQSQSKSQSKPKSKSKRDKRPRIASTTETNAEADVTVPGGDASKTKKGIAFEGNHHGRKDGTTMDHSKTATMTTTMTVTETNQTGTDDESVIYSSESTSEGEYDSLDDFSSTEDTTTSSMSGSGYSSTSETSRGSTNGHSYRYSNRVVSSDIDVVAALAPTTLTAPAPAPAPATNSPNTKETVEMTIITAATTAASDSATSAVFGLDLDSIAAAAAIMAQDQSSNSRRRPVLLGRNAKDGTIHVQLPTGAVIAVEATAFPESLPKPCSTSETDVSPPTIATTTSTASFERVTTKASVREIEYAIPAAASCVFHIFDRRVNLDAHVSGNASDNYSLLRMWAQDDPYRYQPPDVELPRSVRHRRDTVANCNRIENIPRTDDAAAAATKSVTPVAMDTQSVVTDNVVTQTLYSSPLLRKASHSQQKSSPYQSLATPSVVDLRNRFIQQCRAVKKQKVVDFRARDAAILHRLKERGIDLLHRK